MQLAMALHRMLPSQNWDQVGTRKQLISELNTWPACSLIPCYTRNIANTGVGLRAERLAKPYSYDILISLLLTGLSRRFPQWHLL